MMNNTSTMPLVDTDLVMGLAGRHSKILVNHLDDFFSLHHNLSEIRAAIFALICDVLFDKSLCSSNDLTGEPAPDIEMAVLAMDNVLGTLPKKIIEKNKLLQLNKKIASNQISTVYSFFNKKHLLALVIDEIDEMRAFEKLLLDSDLRKEKQILLSPPAPGSYASGSVRVSALNGSYQQFVTSPAPGLGSVKQLIKINSDVEALLKSQLDAKKLNELTSSIRRDLNHHKDTLSPSDYHYFLRKFEHLCSNMPGVVNQNGVDGLCNDFKILALELKDHVQKIT